MRERKRDERAEKNLRIRDEYHNRSQITDHRKRDREKRSKEKERSREKEANEKERERKREKKREKGREKSERERKRAPPTTDDLKLEQDSRHRNQHGWP